MNVLILFIFALRYIQTGLIQNEYYANCACLLKIMIQLCPFFSAVEKICSLNPNVLA